MAEASQGRDELHEDARDSTFLRDRILLRTLCVEFWSLWTRNSTHTFLIGGFGASALPGRRSPSATAANPLARRTFWVQETRNLRRVFRHLAQPR